MSCEAISPGKATFLIIYAQARLGSNMTNCFQILKSHAPSNTASLNSQNHWDWVRRHTAHSLHHGIQFCFPLLRGRGHILNLCKLLYHLTCPQGPGNCTRGERRVLLIPRRGWFLWDGAGESLLSQAVLFTSHDLSLPLRANIILRICPVMVVGFIL